MFLNQIFQVTNAKGEQYYVGAKVFPMSSNIWLNMLRPRCSCDASGPR